MSADHTCAACRWWGEEDERGWRVCDAIPGPQDEDYGDALDSKEPKPAGSERAEVRDGEGYEATLHTAGDFGCALWEAKP